jgi:hypothetical protein
MFIVIYYKNSSMEIKSTAPITEDASNQLTSNNSSTLLVLVKRLSTSNSSKVSIIKSIEIERNNNSYADQSIINSKQKI